MLNAVALFLQLSKANEVYKRRKKVGGRRGWRSTKCYSFNY